VDIDAQAACDSGGVLQQRHLVNDNVKLGRAAARSDKWAKHFSNASCCFIVNFSTFASFVYENFECN